MVGSIVDRVCLFVFMDRLIGPQLSSDGFYSPISLF